MIDMREFKFYRYLVAQGERIILIRVLRIRFGPQPAGRPAGATEPLA